ncbi:MAG TPA: PspC domain-containing protein [Candidatus Limnocylindrales bacterium]
MNRHLYRCRDDRRIAGVAAGVAEYFGLDVTLVRIVWFVSIFFGFFTLVLYVGLALIVPLEPISADAEARHAALAAVGPSGHLHAERRPGMLTTWIGLGLVLLGSLALADVVIPGMSWRYLWPLFVLGVGGLLLAGSLRRGAPAVAAAGPNPAVPAPSGPSAAPALSGPSAPPAPAAAVQPTPTEETSAG